MHLGNSLEAGFSDACSRPRAAEHGFEVLGVVREQGFRDCEGLLFFSLANEDLDVVIAEEFDFAVRILAQLSCMV